MTYFYLDPDQKENPAEVFYAEAGEIGCPVCCGQPSFKIRCEPTCDCCEGRGMRAGLYVWPVRGEVPIGDPIGPYELEEDAINAARDFWEER